MLANLFGTPRRVALGMGRDSLAGLRELGELLAYLKHPDPPRGLRDAWHKLPLLKQISSMAPKEVSGAPCQEVVWEGADVELLPDWRAFPKYASQSFSRSLNRTLAGSRHIRSRIFR